MSVVANLQIAFKVSAILGCTPWYNLKKKEFSNSKLYPMFIILFILILSVLSTMIKIEYIISDGRLGALDAILPFLAFIVNLNNIISAASYNKNKIQLFVRIYDKVYYTLQKFSIRELKNFRYYNIKFSCAYCIVFIFMIFDLTIFYIPGVLPLNISKAIDHINFNGLYLFTILYTSLLNVVYKLYKAMNSMLKSIDTDIQVMNSNKRFDDEILLKVETALSVHYDLGDLVDIFNECFGWHTIGYMSVYIFAFLAAIQHLLEGARLEDLIFSTCWIMFGTVQVIMVTLMCEKVASEGKKTIDISHNFAYRYANTPVREKLFRLCQQSTHRCPEITAAGFHIVNYAILFTYLNLLTTYSIVLIQFSSDK